MEIFSTHAWRHNLAQAAGPAGSVAATHVDGRSADWGFAAENAVRRSRESADAILAPKTFNPESGPLRNVFV